MMRGLPVLMSSGLSICLRSRRLHSERALARQMLVLVGVSFGLFMLTIGYGDLTLSKSWGVLRAIEGANGVILLGWSTAFSSLLSGGTEPSSSTGPEFSATAHRQDNAVYIGWGCIDSEVPAMSMSQSNVSKTVAAALPMIERCHLGDVALTSTRSA